MTRIKLILSISILIGIMIIPAAMGNQGVPNSITQLESSFTGFEIFLIDISNEVNTNALNILHLQGNQTAIEDTALDNKNTILDIQQNLTAMQNTIISQQVVDDLQIRISNSVTAAPGIKNHTQVVCPDNYYPGYQSEEVTVTPPLPYNGEPILFGIHAETKILIPAHFQSAISQIAGVGMFIDNTLGFNQTVTAEYSMVCVQK